MSVVERAVEVYAVRIPAVIYETGKSLNIPLRCYGNLPELSVYFNEEDLFFFILSQHQSDFTSFKTRTELNGLLAKPENAKWFADREARYANYVRRIEDEQIIKGVSQTPPSSPIYTKHKVVTKERDLTQRTLYFREVGSEDEQTNPDWLEENRKYECSFKFTLLNELYDLMGFGALRQSKALSYLLAPGN